MSTEHGFFHFISFDFGGKKLMFSNVEQMEAAAAKLATAINEVSFNTGVVTLGEFLVNALDYSDGHLSKEMLQRHYVYVPKEEEDWQKDPDYFDAYTPLFHEGKVSDLVIRRDALFTHEGMRVLATCSRRFYATGADKFFQVPKVYSHMLEALTLRDEALAQQAEPEQEVVAGDDES